MKKSIVLTIAAAVLFAACAKDAPIESTQVIPATISVAIPADGLTKVALEQDSDPDGVVKLTWESTDAITVKNADDESKTVSFAYKSGAGTASAEFSAADISPLAGATSYNIYLTSNLPGGFTSQTQASDGSTAHLGYAATLRGVNKYDGATFSQSWATSNGGGTLESSSVLRIRAQMPTADIADAVQKVIVKASADIFDGDNELSVEISAPGVAGDSKIVTVYATLPAGDVAVASGTEIIFQFQVSDDVNDKYTAYRKLAAAQTLSSGKVNFFKINCPDIESFAGSDDDGSEGKPYLIGDRHQMDAMHTLLGNDETKYFKMIDDVDLTAVSPWEPLCQAADENKEIYFDGDGHIISHLTANSSTYKYPSFVGFLYGEISNVIFDSANISCGTDKDYSGGVVSGYIGGSGHTGNIKGVTVRNSALVSGGGSAFVGGLGGRVGKSTSILDCHVINTTISTATSGTNVAGLLSYIASNAALEISNCSAEDITVTGGGHYAAGLVSQIASDNVTIRKCHTTGTIKRSSSGRHFGGLVGSVQAANAQIVNCYSTCSVTGYQWSGGLVGSWWSTGSFTGGSGCIDHCFASGTISDKGNSGDGGLVGSLEVPGVTIKNSVAWNSTISPNKYGDANYSSGAVVGRTHPNSRLEENYRKPGMSITAYWTPSASFDHPNSQKVADTYYIWKIGADLVEADGGYTSATAISAPLGLWAYHGKHLPAGAEVEPSATHGWVSDDIPSSEDMEPEAPGWTDTPSIDFVSLGGTTETLRTGVEYIHFHGTWEGEIREINIIKTTLNGHNHIGVYHNYSADSYYYLNQKCEYMDALAGTNGSMQSDQFVRVDDLVKRAAKEVANEWIANCALTIDGDDVNIVKVEDNYAAAMLPNSTVSCAGPLLVWKGNILTASAAWLAADTERWLTTTHPRTAIGLSKDGNTIIQVTVDGRWTSGSDSQRATGMSTDLLAQLMEGLGCYKAMNLDGGGGTQMWVYDHGDIHSIVNHPHNTWPVYGTTPELYTWIKNNEVARRPTGSAIYIKSDLK